MTAMPYGGVPYPYTGQMQYAAGGYGAPMPAMYALPYYMIQPGGGMAAPGQQPFMQGMGGPPAASQPPPSPPADRATLKSQVQLQVEYYFGVDNLLKDVYLRKHMTDEGWVPIQLLTSFRRIQNMTTDISIIMEAINSSQVVEVNPQGTHLRPRNDWPRWVLTPQQQSGTADSPPPQQAAIRSST